VGARSGQNNFRVFQKEKVDGRSKILDATLKSLGRGQKFTDWGAFVTWVSTSSQISTTSLRRNTAYRLKLIEFVAARPSILLNNLTGGHSWQIESADRIKLTSLERENARLKLALEQRLGGAAPMVPLENSNRLNSSQNGGAPFEETAAVLLRLLNHLAVKELGIAVDTDRLAILDCAEDGDDSVIAGPPNTKPFFGWLVRHRMSVEGSA